MNRDNLINPPEDANYIKKQAFNGGIISFITQIALFLISFTTTIILARILNPTDFGLIGMAAFITGLLGLLGDFGLSQALIQRPKLNQNEASILFWTNCFLGIILFIICYISAPYIAQIYDENKITSILQILAIAFPINAIAAQHKAILSRNMRIGILKRNEIISTIIATLCAITSAIYGLGVWALVILTLSNSLSSCLLSWYSSKWIPSIPQKEKSVLSMITFGFHITGFNILNHISRTMDNALIGWKYGSEATGFYTRAYGLLLAPLSNINRPAASVAIPLLSRLNSDPERYKNSYMLITSLILFITCPSVGFIAATSDIIINITLGPQWTEAVPIFACLSIAALFQPFSSTTGWLFISQGRSKDALYWSIFSSATILTSFIIGINWGPIGLALTYSITEALRTPILFWWIGRKGHITAFQLTQTLLPFLLVGILVMFTTLFIRNIIPEMNQFIELFVLFVPGFIIAIIGFLITSNGRNTLNCIWGIFSRLINKKKSHISLEEIIKKG